MSSDFKSVSNIRNAVTSILSKTVRTTKQIEPLKEIIHYNDVLFYVWRSLSKSFLSDKCSDSVYLLNAIELLEVIALPKNLHNNIESDELYLPRQNENKKFILDVPLLTKFIGNVWRSLVNRDLTPVIHKKLLFLLLESYMSKIDNPIFLTDFLMSSMNISGIISILALEGVSQLMQKHNIEYPNVYGKLYTMFQPGIFHKKFKTRLFYLADIFLSSICLPEIIVASFVKKVARLSLMAPACDIPLALRFIGNLLIRHPSLKSMIHHENDVEGVPLNLLERANIIKHSHKVKPSPVLVSEDPFLMEEKDPTKTCASKSSLWEIALLKNHCLPTASSASKFIDFNLPSMEYDLKEVFNKSCQDLFESESKKKKTEKPSLTFERPQHSIAKLKDDRLYKLWSLTE